MLFGLLGWDEYDGQAERMCEYFTSSGSGQVSQQGERIRRKSHISSVEFHFT